MTAADWLNVGLVATYIILAASFAASGNLAKMFYWVGAGILTASLLWVK